jgi:cysteine desulfurase
VRLQPQNIGGHQERDIRGGTEPVPNLVAFGEACEIAAERMERDAANAAVLREHLEKFIGERVADCHFNGDRDSRLPNIANISFGSIEGEGLLINLDMQGIAVSTGSACSSGTLEPSPVIRAIGRGDDLARGAIRFSFGRFNTEADLERLMEILPSSIETLRKLNPTQMKKAV